MSEVIVTAANSKYNQLLKGLIFSTRPYKVCVLDLGLESYEIDWLKSQGCDVKKPEPILGNSEMRDSVLGYVERPSITQIFPDYEKYLWLDSDVWVQDISAIKDLFDACDRFDVCVVPEIDRNFINKLHLQSNLWKFEKMEQYYGELVALELSHIPMFNSGVVAAKKESQIWTNWSSALAFILINGHEPDFGIDQISLNYALGKSELKVGMFSALYNWTLHLGMPIIKDGKLVEAMPPHNIIKLIHLSSNSKNYKHNITRFEGGIDIRHLEWFDFNGT